MKTRTIIILIAVGVLLLWLLTRYFGSKQPQEGQDNGQYPLGFGSRSEVGSGVHTLQKVCNDVLGSIPGYQSLAEDGIWGNKTEAAMLDLKNLTVGKTSDGLLAECLPFSQFIIFGNDGKCMVENVENFNHIVRMAKTYKNCNGDYDTLAAAISNATE